jgi:hypothetical protein
LFTDLVSSTELLQATGDERAQRVFSAHHKLLQEAVAVHGGDEVRWLGDGLMVAFASAADAVRCAISMQQTARRPVSGERLEVRAGLNVGELVGDEAEYFGTPVEVARKLCDRAEARQILVSDLVVRLLSGRQAFEFAGLGEVALPGMREPVAVSQVTYEIDQPTTLLSHPPFVGRGEEIARLENMLQQAREGRGGLLMLVGEPGIGKTRTAEEFADAARHEGATIMWGRCYEGEWAPPYGPFSEALEEYAKTAPVEVMRNDLGAAAGPLSRVAPALQERLPDIPEPETLRPDEERFRLADALTQFLIATCARAPLVIVLDDVHWADKGTVALLRHVARFASRHPILLVIAYRDVELDRHHPLADALGALRREANCERVALKGLASTDIERLLGVIAEQDVPDALVQVLHDETDGNPFFMREILLHLLETGKVHGPDGTWAGDAASIARLQIPEGVRQVIGQRLSRLSDDANKLLTSASAFSGVFRFEIAASVGGLDEPSGLDAVDEALQAQLLRPSGEADAYRFTHALIRHTLYSEMNPSRQVRLHRQIAETMERVYGERASDHAAELAYQYHRSAAMPGSELGASYALIAAERAESAYAHDDVATFLNMALELLPEFDPARPRILARAGTALAWSLEFDAARQAATKAGNLIATSEGASEAAAYLAEAARGMALAGNLSGAWALATEGLRHAGGRRDTAWAWLMSFDLMRREAEDPQQPGIPLDTPERRQVSEIVRHLPHAERPPLASPFADRAEVLTEASDDPLSLTYLAGNFRASLPLLLERAAQREQQGRIASAVSEWSLVSRCYNALGDLAAAQEAFNRGSALVSRLPGPSAQTMQLFSTSVELRFTRDRETQQPLAEGEALMQQLTAELSYAAAPIRATAALGYAWQGRAAEAMTLLGTLIQALDRAPAWAPNYTLMACLAASVLWVLDRTDHIDVIEACLRDKVVAPDFRFPMQDGRLSLARLAAVRGDAAAATVWFAQARDVLDEQGARPLRAITDLDEAGMYLRVRDNAGREQGRPLIEAALAQFRRLGMNGWTTHAESFASGWLNG